MVYVPESVPLFEALYGKNLISLGGLPAVDRLFSTTSLTIDDTLLDIGFGLGGATFHIADKYNAKVFGVEIHPWMVEHARAHTPQKSRHLLHFSTYTPNGKLPFNEAQFSLAYSKGVLNHVHDKAPLLNEVYRVLKPSALFIIADWIHPTSSADPDFPLIQESKHTYTEQLEKAGFTEICFIDENAHFYQYTKTLLENLQIHEELIKTEFGEDTFTAIQEQHKKLLVDIENSCKSAVKITVKKPNQKLRLKEFQ